MQSETEAPDDARRMNGNSEEPQASLPLAGMRVIDMTTMLSGPVATLQLADLGADVIKIEPPEGDAIRDMVPQRSAGMAAMFLHVNHGKRSVVLDLKQAAAREALLRLVAGADVFVCNARVNAMRRLGLHYDALRAVNPALIYLSIVGYGSAGPYGSRPAYDDLIQGAVGIPSLGAAQPDGQARYAPIAVADRVTGMQAASAVLGALVHKLRTGEGQHVEVPMFETLAAMVLADHMGGRTFEPAEGPPIYQRYATIRRPFPTRDGHVCLMIHTDRQWRVFFEATGNAGLIDDPRFCSVAQRTANTEALYGLVADVLREGATGDWIALFERIDIPAVQLHTIDSLIDDPHLAAVRFFQELDHPSEGRIRATAPLGTWSRSAPGPRTPAPRLGQHSVQVLREAGLSSEQIERMMASAATGGER